MGRKQYKAPAVRNTGEFLFSQERHILNELEQAVTGSCFRSQSTNHDDIGIGIVYYSFSPQSRAVMTSVY
jgi:hypothetical protein